MKSQSKLILVAMATVLGCWSVNGSAITLGRASGAVLLGKPLGISIALQMDAVEAAEPLCFDADVFYGDQRQVQSKVNVVKVPADPSRATRLSVVTVTLVDEPVVTVYVRSGCMAKTTRKYVLLAEVATDLLPPVSESESVSLVRGPLPSAAKPSVVANALAAKGNTTAAATTAPNTKSARPRPKASLQISKGSGVAKRSEASSPSLSSPAAVASKPRLKLSMLELVDIKDPSLRWTQELLAAPTEDPKKRELAAAAWRLLSTTEQDVVAADESQRSLSDDLQKLKLVTAKNLQDQQDLSMRLVKAESERFTNPLVIALAILTLIALVSMLVMWLKTRQQFAGEAPWWGGASTANDREMNATDLASLVSDEPETLPPHVSVGAHDSDLRVDAPPLRYSTRSPKPDLTALDIDLGIDDRQEPRMSSGAAKEEPLIVVPEPVQVSALNRKGGQLVGARRDFAHSLNATLHAINTTEMLDVRQQADFFMTLGQHEEAIQVLEENINRSGSSNPLVFMDLLKVLHTLSKKPEFDHYRAEFNVIFTGKVPDFQSFHRPGQSLEAYPEICEEITKLWGTDDVIDYLEDCMIRTDEDRPEDHFELNAYRDLLTLHALASRIMAESASESSLVPFSAARPDRDAERSLDSATPLTSFDAEATMPLPTSGAADNSMGIDLDLSEDDGNLIHYDISEFELTPKK